VVLAVLVAALVIAAAIVIPLTLGGDDEDDGDRRADESADTDDPTHVDTSDLEAVRSYDNPGAMHVPDGETIDYPQSPPVGGEHRQRWIECGVYDEELPNEHVVHDLEHGTVWITYREDDVDADEIDGLAEQLPGNGILSPYDDQDAPVVITVWDRQLELVGADDPRIDLFIDEYGAGETAPEPFASCNGGITPYDTSGDNV